MIRATLKSLLSRKLRLILSGLAVILGVMFVSGSFVLTDTLTRSFDQLFAGIFADTDVQVAARPTLPPGEFDDSEQVTSTLTDADLQRTRGIDGVAGATGVVFADNARLIGQDGKTVPSVGPPRFGGDWPSQAPSVELRQGRGPVADNEIAINAALATAAGVRVGDRVGVLTVFAPRQEFTLVGVFGYPGGRDSQGGSQVVLFSLPAAQHLMLGGADLYSTVDLKAAAGVSDDALRDRVAATLGDGYLVKTGQQLADEQASALQTGLKFFNYILIGFASVALFVATFLILNTFSIIVAQRTRELALMRAIGASRRQVVGSVMLEAVVIGLLASVVGLALGIGVGALLATFFSNVSGGLELASIGVPAPAWISAFGVGVGITVVAALIPALRAARIAPVAAMRESATPDRPLTKLTISGGVVLGLGAVGLALGLTDNAGDQGLWAILGGVLLAFVGTALLTPLIARPVAGLIGRLFAFSVPGRLGRLNAGRNPRRTAITAGALMVGIALITGINTVFVSAKESITKIADDQAHVDLIISGDMSAGRATFDPAVLDRTAGLPGVAAVTGLYEDAALVNGDRTFVGAFTNAAAVPSMFSLTPAAGSIASIPDGSTIVDETTAADLHLGVGSPITVQLARGAPITLTVSGIYHTSDLIAGFAIPISAVSNFSVPQPSSGFIQVSPGSSVDEIKAQVSTLLKDSPEVSVGDRTEFIAQQTASADQVLVMVQILLALAILIAVLGVINTLALSVLERTRELGLLRAVGLRRGQTMWMVTVEAVVISVFGAVLGLAVGVGLGAAVVRALRDEGITDLSLPWVQMVTYLILAAVVGVVAAVLPAIRAARTNVLAAIAYE